MNLLDVNIEDQKTSFVKRYLKLSERNQCRSRVKVCNIVAAKIWYSVEFEFAELSLEWPVVFQLHDWKAIKGEIYSYLGCVAIDVSGVPELDYIEQSSLLGDNVIAFPFSRIKR